MLNSDDGERVTRRGGSREGGREPAEAASVRRKQMLKYLFSLLYHCFGRAPRSLFSIADRVGLTERSP